MALGKKVMELAEFYDGKAELMGHYPAWEYKHESALRDTMVAVYEKLYGQKPQVVSIHAGLECGLLSDKKPGLDCVSIGPSARHPYQPGKAGHRLHRPGVGIPAGPAEGTVRELGREGNSWIRFTMCLSQLRPYR